MTGHGGAASAAQEHAFRPDTRLQRLRVVLHGTVQGVGFRPFVYRLATELGLTGWVCNTAHGVCLEVEGSHAQLQDFLRRLDADKPPHARIQQRDMACLVPVGSTAFIIQESRAGGEKTALLLPDLATCADCLQELFNPQDRRYRYPFINCTHCGPRFSIVEAVPYDRRHTTMRHFPMCQACQAEYDDPLDRRFHAQPNACPQCGPQLAFWDRHGQVLATRHEAVLAAAAAIRQGAIVAVKGLGGFHLLVDAGNATAVQRLRQRKRRQAKPFALLYPALEAVRQHCCISDLEAHLLRSPAAPLVLLRRLPATAPHDAVAPGNPSFGVMLPANPLHHLLMAELRGAVVATSGNRSDEPICTDEGEALARLAGIADWFLVHNRPIAQHVDDSIVRVLLGRPQVLRRARGYAPLPVRCASALSQADPEPERMTCLPAVLAVGGQEKNTVAMTVGHDVLLSQHIGALETSEGLNTFSRVVTSLCRLYEVHPTLVACDSHPGYLSTQWAAQRHSRRVAVQHHYAHVLACMADNDLTAPVLGVAWDGTGYGLDGTIWGGEFLQITADAFIRMGHVRPFRLPGGAKAITEPRRAALGLLYSVFGDRLLTMPELVPCQTFSARELHLICTMLRQGLNAPLTSSVGRLFDAMAAIVGFHQMSSFEGQAAMALEFAAQGQATEATYPYGLTAGAPLLVDWQPMVCRVFDDLRQRVPVGEIAAKFHHTLVDALVAVARRVGERRIVLTGGCFQNRYLTERAVYRLRAAGFTPYWHQHVPPNDGGLALGQVIAALRADREE
jgi:hydrogenase maturation protein HypF